MTFDLIVELIRNLFRVFIIVATIGGIGKLYNAIREAESLNRLTWVLLKQIHREEIENKKKEQDND